MGCVARSVLRVWLTLSAQLPCHWHAFGIWLPALLLDKHLRDCVLASLLVLPVVVLIWLPSAAGALQRLVVGPASPHRPWYSQHLQCAGVGLLRSS